MASELLPALSRRGHEVVVLTERSRPELPAEDEHRGIPVYRFPFVASLRDVDRLSEIRQRLLQLKRNFAPDLSHTVALGATDFYYDICADVLPTPRLVSLHGEWPQRYRRLLRTALSSADRLVCDSTATLDYARSLVPGIEASSSVIRNAVKVPRLAPTSLPFDRPTVLYLGRLSQEKGVDLAVTAFASVVQRHPDVRLVLAGDGPERDALQRQVIRLGVVDAVRFAGWVAEEDVPALLNTAVMLILPSRADSFPLAALQASLMERPIVAARVGGLPELVVDGETGRLAEKEDGEALAEAVCGLLSRPEDAVRMGRAARRRALESFPFERLVDQYEAVYRKVGRDWSECCDKDDIVRG